MSRKTLLITGGAGYIGSHAVVAFEEAGYKTVSIDNFSNADRWVLSWITDILWYEPDFYEGDIRERSFLEWIFERYTFDGVIHFAWWKSVAESVSMPTHYHDNNIGGSMTLFSVMASHDVKKIVFSSSATIYDPTYWPEYYEDTPCAPTSPYGTTKYCIEQLLTDLSHAYGWSVITLRYFNPIGAHPSGKIGERPQWTPNNLLPLILDVAYGIREKVYVFGDDYDTPDGTCGRDYIDISDLVEAHVSAYARLFPWFLPVNIGTGETKSVLEMIDLVSRVTGRPIPYERTGRRPWDVSLYYANTERAWDILSWKARTSVAESIEKAWRFKHWLPRA